MQSSRRGSGKIGGLVSQELSGDLPERGSQGDGEGGFAEGGGCIWGGGQPRDLPWQTWEVCEEGVLEEDQGVWGVRSGRSPEDL